MSDLVNYKQSETVPITRESLQEFKEILSSARIDISGYNLRLIIEESKARINKK